MEIISRFRQTPSPIPDMAEKLDGLMQNESMLDGRPLTGELLGLSRRLGVGFVPGAQRQAMQDSYEAIKESLRHQFGASIASAFEREFIATALTVGGVRSFFSKYSLRRENYGAMQESFVSTFEAGAHVTRVNDAEEVLIDFNEQQAHAEGPEQTEVKMTTSRRSLREMGYYLSEGESDKMIPTAYLRHLGKVERTELRDELLYDTRSRNADELKSYLYRAKAEVAESTRKADQLSTKIKLISEAEDRVKALEEQVIKLCDERDLQHKSRNEAQRELEEISPADKTKRPFDYAERSEDLASRIRVQGEVTAELEHEITRVVEELVAARTELTDRSEGHSCEQMLTQLVREQERIIEVNTFLEPFIEELTAKIEESQEWCSSKLKAYCGTVELTKILRDNIRSLQSSLQSMEQLPEEKRDENYAKKLEGLQVELQVSQRNFSATQAEIREKFSTWSDEEAISYVLVKRAEQFVSNQVNATQQVLIKEKEILAALRSRSVEEKNEAWSTELIKRQNDVVMHQKGLTIAENDLARFEHDSQAKHTTLTGEEFISFNINYKRIRKKLIKLIDSQRTAFNEAKQDCEVFQSQTHEEYHQALLFQALQDETKIKVELENAIFLMSAQCQNATKVLHQEYKSVDWDRFSLIINGKQLSCSPSRSAEENIREVRQEITALRGSIPTDEELYQIMRLFDKEGRTSGFPTGANPKTGLALETEHSGSGKKEQVEITLALDGQSLDLHYESAQNYLKGINSPNHTSADRTTYNLSSIMDGAGELDRMDRDRDIHIQQFQTSTKYTYRYQFPEPSENSGIIRIPRVESIAVSQGYWPVEISPLAATTEARGSESETAMDSTDRESLTSEESH